jgi:hypothetical protein
MNIHQLNVEMRTIAGDLGRRTIDDRSIIERLQNLADAYGAETLASWTHPYTRRNEGTILHYCVMGERDKVFDYCVKSLGCNVNHQRKRDGCTPAHLVIYHNRLWMVSTVLAHNPDLTLRNKYNEDCSPIRC